MSVKETLTTATNNFATSEAQTLHPAPIPAQNCHSDRSEPTPLPFSFAPANESARAVEESLFDPSRSLSHLTRHSSYDSLTHSMKSTLPTASSTATSFQAATRLQLSITSNYERRILAYLAQRLPKQIHSDHLTLLGLISMFAAGASYALARYNHLGLLGATLALATNWFGDSLDGTLARHRNQQRPRYGFYVDHLIDSFGALFLTAGLAASAYMAFPTAAALLVAFLLLSIESYLATYTLGVFHMSHAGLGPTEIRILLAIANLTLYFHPQFTYIHLHHQRYRLLDFAGIISASIMFLMVIAASIIHTRTLYQQETKPLATVATPPVPK
jgi:phosphatidylglycerophosphate synthase